MQRVTKYFFIFVLLACLLPACTSLYDKVLKSNDADLKYKTAKIMYDAGKYQKAATLYEQSAMFFRGLPQDDSLNFFLAKSYFKSGDVYSAEYYFSQFLNTFPRSPFAEEAAFLHIISLYDQTQRYELDQMPSYKTLSAITDFNYTYPKSKYTEECNKVRDELLQRIDQKQFESAKLYFTIEEYKAAIMALHTSLKDFPESRYREDILYLLVVSTYRYAENSYRHKQKDRFQAVIDEYYNFVSEFPESKYRAEVEQMHVEALGYIRKEQAAKAQPTAEKTPTEN